MRWRAGIFQDAAQTVGGGLANPDGEIADDGVVSSGFVGDDTAIAQQGNTFGLDTLGLLIEIGLGLRSGLLRCGGAACHQAAQGQDEQRM